MKRLSILAITSQLPWPLDTGGHLRSFNLLTGLAAEFDVRVLAGVGAPYPEGVAALEARGLSLTAVGLPPRQSWREGARMLAAAARREPYVLGRRHDHPELRAAIRRAIRERKPDVVYFDHLDSAVFANEFHDSRRVVDLHNVYSLIARRSGDEHARFLARAYLRREARLLARMEHRVVSTMDAIFAVSEEERHYYAARGAARAVLVPNGVDCDAYARLPTGRPASGPVVLYVGTMSWTPNATAAAFLADHVLPAVRARIPDAQLRIVGKHPPASLQARDGRDGVDVLGGVPDVRPHLEDAAVLAVPLETGGGTRLKILEAFAAGLPVVSTPVGAEGIECESGRHLEVVERGAFAGCLTELLEDPARGVRLAREARATVRSTYDWSVVVAAAVRAIEQMMSDTRSGAPGPSTSSLLGQRLHPPGVVRADVGRP